MLSSSFQREISSFERPLMRSDVEVFEGTQVVTDRYLSLGVPGGNAPLLMDNRSALADLEEAKISILLRASGLMDPLRQTESGNGHYGRVFVSVNQPVVLHFPTALAPVVAERLGKVKMLADYIAHTRSFRCTVLGETEQVSVADIYLDYAHRWVEVVADHWHTLSDSEFLTKVRTANAQ